MSDTIQLNATILKEVKDAAKAHVDSKRNYTMAMYLEDLIKKDLKLKCQ